MRRFFISLTVQDPFDLHVGPDNKTIFARTTKAVWPIVFKSSAEAFEHGRRCRAARNGWLPDGRVIICWTVSCTLFSAAEEAAQP